MSYPVHYPVVGDTLPIFFDTFDGGTGASITMTGLAVTDIEIYKDGSATQRASDAGYALLDTDGIDFDGLTGIHGFSIDLSDNTDAGFFEVGPWYHVVVSSVTVDGQTVNFVAAAFRIISEARGMAGTALPNAASDAAGGLPISDAGGLDLDTKLANTNEVTVARMGALTDWIDGGRLDLLIDAILTDTGTTLDGKIDTIDGIVDTIVARVLGTIAAGTHNPQSGDAFARLGAPVGASISADIAATPTLTELQGEIDDVQTDVAGVKTVADAVQAKTDSLTFTVAGKVDANTTHLNEIAVGGVGTAVSPWGPA